MSAPTTQQPSVPSSSQPAGPPPSCGNPPSANNNASGSQQQQQGGGSRHHHSSSASAATSSSAAARQQRALFKPFLHTLRGYIASNNNGSPQTPGSSAAQAGFGSPPGSDRGAGGGGNSNNNNNNNNNNNSQLIIHAESTPNERETGRLSRSGRALSEMEILQEKHEPEFRRLMPVVASALKDVVAIHEPLRAFAPPDDRYSYYETNAPPGITLDAYVQRIAEYTYISPATLLVSLMILDRLAGRHPTLLFTTLNIYKLFFVAVRISSKVVDLRTLNNKNFAPVGGISNRHLNDIEARMLIDLRFDLYISPADFKAYVRRATDGVPQPIAISSSFQRAMAQMQASQRNAQSRQNFQSGANSDSGSDSQQQEGGATSATSLDQFSQSSDATNKVLPPNPAALAPSAAVAPLAL